MIIGIGNLPASYDGALMADLAADGTVTPEYTLSEQGVADILRLDDGSLVVCGCDAAFADDWTAGNIYLRSADGVWTKKRTLQNVLHVWGACIHSGKLYVATGAHTGDNATWQARCFISDDWGDTWQSHHVCYYRIYDIFSFDGSLYATAWDWPNYKLYKSADGGVTWSAVPNVEPEPRIRMVLWNNHLVGVLSGGPVFGFLTPPVNCSTGLCHPEPVSFTNTTSTLLSSLVNPYTYWQPRKSGNARLSMGSGFYTAMSG